MTKMHFKMSCFGYSDFSEIRRQCILINRKYYSAFCNMASLTMYLIHEALYNLQYLFSIYFDCSSAAIITSTIYKGKT